MPYLPDVSNKANGRHSEKITIPRRKPTNQFSTTMIGLESDVTISINSERVFHLHKFPLYSKTRYFEENEDDYDPKAKTSVTLNSFPGGPDIFVQVVNYCYGLKMIINPSNLGALLCGGYYLKMISNSAESGISSKKKSETLLEVLESKWSAISESWNDVFTVLKSYEQEDCKAIAEKEGLIEKCVTTLCNATNGSLGTEHYDSLSSLQIGSFLAVVFQMRKVTFSETQVLNLIASYVSHWEESWKSRQKEGTRDLRKINKLFLLIPSLKGDTETLFRLLNSAVELSIENSVMDCLIRSSSEHLMEASMNSLQALPMNMAYKLFQKFFTEVNQGQKESTTAAAANLLNQYLQEMSTSERATSEAFLSLVGLFPQTDKSDHCGVFAAVRSFVEARKLSLPDSLVLSLVKFIKPSKLSEEVLEAAANDPIWPLPFTADILLYQKQFYAGKAALLQRENLEMEMKLVAMEDSLKSAGLERDRMEDRIGAMQREVSNLCLKVESLNAVICKQFNEVIMEDSEVSVSSKEVKKGRFKFFQPNK